METAPSQSAETSANALSADVLGAAGWAVLRAAALTGTRQSAAALPDFAPLIAAPSAPDDPDAKARQLLRAAGTLGLLRRAGQVPAEAAAVPEPAAPESRAELGAEGQRAVWEMVEREQYRGHLVRYLGRLAASNRRLPHGDMLVQVLHHLSKEARKGAAAWARPALGERGVWLAAFNPKWADALGAVVVTDPQQVDAADLSIWETGTWDQRLAWLNALFATDAPAARALLLAALPTEPARQQEPLLNLLGEDDHLTPEAEPVLEALLKARGQEVRRLAAELLVRIPGAALVERLWARVEPLVQRKTALLSKDSLEVQLPTAWDKTWLLDGIEEKSDHYRWRFNLNTGTGHGNATVGEAAVRLGTMLALVPVRRWMTHFGVSAAELLALAMRTKDWQQALLVGWSMSAVNTLDYEVIEAFLELYFSRFEVMSRAANGVRWYELVQTLPLERRAAVVGPPLLTLVRANRDGWPERISMMPEPWPRELVEGVVTAILAKAATTAGINDLHNDLSRYRYQTIGQLADKIADEYLPWAIQRLTPVHLPPMHEAFRQSLRAVHDELVFRQILADSLL